MTDRPKCTCDPQGQSHVVRCPLFKGAVFKPQPRNEISVRREAAQIAQRRMWGEG